MTAQLNRPKLNFILEDEVEGMMAEDKNVLIKAEQNKKKIYLPTELWDIVKSYALYPTKVHQAIEIRCKKELAMEFYDGLNIWRMSHCWMNLKKYIHQQSKKKETYVCLGIDTYEMVLQSRAVKAKEEAILVLQNAIKYAEKKYRERKQYYYSNAEFAISFRKYHSDKDEVLPRWSDYDDARYNEYLKSKTLI